MTDQQPASSAVPVRRNPAWHEDWRGKLVFGVAFAVFGALIAQAFSYWNNRLRVMTYSVQKNDSLIQKPTTFGNQHTVDVMVDSRLVENISTVTVYLRNTSGRDFKPLSIEVHFDAGKNMPVLLLQSSSTADRREPTTQPERILHENQTPNEMEFDYTLPVVNRPESSDENAFVGTYIFNAEKAPDVTLIVQEAGVTTSKFSGGNSQTSNGENIFDSVSAIIAGAVVTGILFSFFKGRAEQKRE